MTNKEQKTERLRCALSHREGDRVPVGEFFWTGFLNRCREKMGRQFDPYRHFDLDYVVVTPNMDPKIQPFKVVQQSGEDIVVKTGFGATIRRRGTAPMPHYETFSVHRAEQMADVELDSPADPRRFFAGGDDQINCVGDAMLRDIPAWDGRVDAYADDFAVFGSLCEPYEYLWRIIGSENALYWMATDTELFNAFVDRLGAFLLEFARAQIEAGASGMYIWGDVAYVNGMLFGTALREVSRPHVEQMIDLCHEHGLMTIYHGCGDARAIFGDMVEIGLDGYNPLEAKAHLDVVELKKQYAGRLGFVGNIDVRSLESGDPEKIRQRGSLQASGRAEWRRLDMPVGSFDFRRHHDGGSELAIRTVRELGNYPLNV